MSLVFMPLLTPRGDGSCVACQVAFVRNLCLLNREFFRYFISWLMFVGSSMFEGSGTLVDGCGVLCRGVFLCNLYLSIRDCLLFLLFQLIRFVLSMFKRLRILVDGSGLLYRGLLCVIYIFQSMACFSFDFSSYSSSGCPCLKVLGFLWIALVSFVLSSFCGICLPIHDYLCFLLFQLIFVWFPKLEGPEVLEDFSCLLCLVQFIHSKPCLAFLFTFPANLSSSTCWKVLEFLCGGSCILYQALLCHLYLQNRDYLFLCLFHLIFLWFSIFKNPGNLGDGSCLLCQALFWCNSRLQNRDWLSFSLFQLIFVEFSILQRPEVCRLCSWIQWLLRVSYLVASSFIRSVILQKSVTLARNLLLELTHSVSNSPREPLSVVYSYVFGNCFLWLFFASLNRLSPRKRESRKRK